MHGTCNIQFHILCDQHYPPTYDSVSEVLLRLYFLISPMRPACSVHHILLHSVRVDEYNTSLFTCLHPPLLSLRFSCFPRYWPLCKAYRCNLVSMRHMTIFYKIVISRLGFQINQFDIVNFYNKPIKCWQIKNVNESLELHIKSLWFNDERKHFCEICWV
jgi:hypothetical protein